MAARSDEVRVDLDDNPVDDSSSETETDFEYPELEKSFGEPVVVMHHVKKGTAAVLRLLVCKPCCDQLFAFKDAFY